MRDGRDASGAWVAGGKVTGGFAGWIVEGGGVPGGAVFDAAC